MRYCAHSRNAAGHRQDLLDHLQAVSGMAGEFAAPFAGDTLARYAGLCHDIGKFNPEFQQYLLRCESDPRAQGRGPDHKAAGAQVALRHAPPVALLVQGHHGGLRARADLQGWLKDHANDRGLAEALQAARALVPALEPAAPLPPPAYVRDPSSGELFVRMLFSALVDADCLDTEAHFDPARAARRGGDVSLSELWERFDRDQRHVLACAHGEVGRVRAAIYQACLDAAELAPGLFRLTVPTGGGKTRSGMAFALRHALRHGLRRVIVVVPFITITEQTADTYRRIFEAGAEETDRPIVLEHHSAVDDATLDDESGDFHADAIWRRLAAENWDAPIVVTTTVQLFQSLFACKTRGVRKLHRLAQSVIILDEAQALPPPLLDPLLDALRQLCANYGATVVLSTATQPAFEIIRVFADLPAQEIVPDPARYFQALKRVDYEWRTGAAMSWQEVAGLMRGAPAALAVVNTKRDALALLDALGDPEALHLSTLLCGAHRRRVIAEVKRRLAAGEPCRLVATQVVEAGVDLDFPLVLRALGPLDGIIQAAGRCNREGLLPRGRVIVFRPLEGGMPKGTYTKGAGVTETLLGRGDLDPDSPGAAHDYFTRLFAVEDLDRERIQPLRAAMDYPEVARRFRMIEDDAESIVVPYGTEEEQAMVRGIVDELRAGSPRARALLRRLQPYTVAVRRRDAREHAQQGWISSVIEGLGEWLGAYDAVRGLAARDRDPDAWIV